MVAAVLAFCRSSAAQTKTTVSDSLFGPGGTAVAGTLTITNPNTFTSSDGFVILQGQAASITIGANGSFTVQLVPNIGASPSGTSYIAQYRTPQGNVREIWIVPQSASPVNLLTVRTLNPPSPGLLIPFPQNIPPPNCLDHMVPEWILPPGQWSCGNANSGAVTMSLENPTAADTGRFQWKPRNSLSLTRLSCSTDQGTAQVNLDVRLETSPNVFGTQVLSAPLTCTPTTGVTTTFSTTTIPSEAPVALILTGTGGGVTVVRVHAEYKLNP